MTSYRRQRLEALTGWSWGVVADQWEDGFSRLKQFSGREGHCRVPDGYKTDDGYRLAAWVERQRARKDKIEPDRRQRLEALTGWSWSVVADQWEDGFSRLKQFSEREGDCRVSKNYRTKDGYRLGGWVNNQRASKEAMNPERLRRLEALTGWSWEVRFELWEEGFSHLKHFSERKGHCRVPVNYEADDGYRLGAWVHKQRGKHDRRNPDRRHRLEALPGWSWDVVADLWEDGFSRLLISP
jgi:Helicase associated domain